MLIYIILFPFLISINTIYCYESSTNIVNTVIEIINQNQDLGKPVLIQSIRDYGNTLSKQEIEKFEKELDDYIEQRIIEKDYNYFTINYLSKSFVQGYYNQKKNEIYDVCKRKLSNAIIKVSTRKKEGIIEMLKECDIFLTSIYASCIIYDTVILAYENKNFDLCYKVSIIAIDSPFIELRSLGVNYIKKMVTIQNYKIDNYEQLKKNWKKYKKKKKVN